MNGSSITELHQGGRRRWAVPLLLCFGSLLVCTQGFAENGVAIGPNDVGSIFHVRKSENRNQVHYGIRLDRRCRPVGDAPVFAYWQELEQSPDMTLPLNTLEQQAYGIHQQRVDLLQSRSGRVTLTLAAARKRTVLVESYRDDGYRCQARALTRIDNEKKAQIDHIYVKIGMLKRVEYVQLKGVSLGGRAVLERILR